MIRTLALASLRHALRHPWQFGLALIGIAVGVAVVVAVDLSVESARRAFAASSEAVLGRATHRVVGGPAGVSDAAYAALRRAVPQVPAAPVIEGRVRVEGPGGRDLTLLGVDPFADVAFRRHVPGVGSGTSLATLLIRPGAVLVTGPTAARLGVGPGDALRLRVAGRQAAGHVAGLLAGGGKLEATRGADLLVADLATAQEILARTGLTHVDLVLGTGPDERRDRAAIEALLPPGLTLVETGPRSRAAAGMTDAFDLNLRMLSLLALVVGMFLIYNTMTFSVVQRRTLIGTLRAIGVTRGQVLGLFVVEAVAIGAAGTALGLAGGVVLAQHLIGLVVQTVNDLYFGVSVESVVLPAGAFAKAGVLGVGASVLAAAAPARAAGRVTPRAALSRAHLESSARRLVPRAALAGTAIGVAGLALLAVPGGVGMGFAGLFALIGAFALVAPAATLVLARSVDAAAARFGGVMGPMGTRGVIANLSRTAVAVAALMVAISATIGIGLMVSSFRHGVANWLEVTLRADVYVGVPGSGTRPPLDPSVAARIAATPGVSHFSAGWSARIESDSGPIDLVVLKMAPESYRGFQIVQGEAAAAWPAFDHREAVLISEPFAARHGVGPGGRVALLTDRGFRDFDVAAVFRDYGSDRGVVLMGRATWDRHWRAGAATSLGVYAEPGTSAEVLRERLAESLGQGSPVVVRDNATIRAASLEIFDRTFAITRVLRLLAVAVAFVGVLSALMAIQMEREKEIAVLRAIGLLPVQVWVVVQSQTALLGLIAGLLSVPLGLVIAAVLVHVVNRRSFGWSMELGIEPGALALAVGLALLAALAAGVYPAWRMARTSPAVALREE